VRYILTASANDGTTGLVSPTWQRSFIETVIQTSNIIAGLNTRRRNISIYILLDTILFVLADRQRVLRWAFGADRAE
jgi:hypothetical protein